MKLKTLLTILFLSIIYFSCSPVATTDDIMRSWENQPVSKLIKEWGPAHNISTDGQGGKVYSYYFNRSRTNTTYTPEYGTGVYDPTGGKKNTTTTNWTAERHFYVNSDGYIYYWRWKGK